MAKRPTTEILDAVNSATKVIAHAAEEAKKVIADAASEALKVQSAQHVSSKEDHDLLIELKTKMDDLKADIKELKDGTSSKIDNHESRIMRLEKAGTTRSVLISIGIGMLTLLTGIIIYHIQNIH